MGVVVQFSYDAWIAEFPEFAGVNKQQATGYFNRATIFHRNDGVGPVTKATIQTELLNLATAHIAFLSGALSAPNPGAVGRVSSATEGSVSASFEMGSSASDQKAFWTQSQYGAQYWAATNPYRRFRWRMGPQPVNNPWPGVGWPPPGWPIS